MIKLFKFVTVPTSRAGYTLSAILGASFLVLLNTWNVAVATAAFAGLVVSAALVVAMFTRLWFRSRAQWAADDV